MFGLLRKAITPIFTTIRHPFKSVQRYFHIEQEWTQFKTSVKPHRYKIMFLSAFITFPLYRDLLPEVKTYTAAVVQEELKPGSPIDSLT